MDELAGLLGRERRLLEVLLFKLVEARHLLAAGEARFLPWAAVEVERAVERVKEAELLRATLVARLARDFNLSPVRLSLKELAEDSPEPYRTIFADHRQAFLELVAEIEEATKANRKLAGQGLRGVSEVLTTIAEGHGERRGGVGRLYGPDQAAPLRQANTRPGPMRVDRAL